MSGFLSGAAARLQTLLASATGAVAVVFRRAGAGGVNRTVAAKLQDTFDVRDRGILVDGATDQTAALVALLTALGVEGFRGLVNIPYNCKFDPITVWNACPLGVELDDYSCINWGQPPSYKSNFRVRYRGDAVNDDKQEIIASNHHPALMLMNTGAAGTALGLRRGVTILHAIGRDVVGDPLLGWLTQYSKDPSTDEWIIQDRLQTPYPIAIQNPTYWATGVNVAVGVYKIGPATGRVYISTTAGVTGVNEPLVGGGSVSDGAVTWAYVQEQLALDATRRQMSETGKMGLYGKAGGSPSLTLQAGVKTLTLETNDTTGDSFIRDQGRAIDLVRLGTAAGLRLGGVQSFNRVNHTHAGPAAVPVSTALIFIDGAGDITGLTPPAGQTSGTVVLWFSGAGVTLKNNASIVTRTGADIASAANLMVGLLYDASVSGSWVVMWKN